MKIKPLGERVLIEPLEAKSTTSGGIIIPENAKEKPSKGTVVAVGSTEEGKGPDSKSRRYRSVWQIFRY
jgi:co-chaperonin GroES (HSP10)